MEPRFDCKIIVVGHLMAGKTTLIWRLLLENFDMSQTKRTNGIIILHKGAMCIKDREWITTKKPDDLEQVLRRMQRAKTRRGHRGGMKMSLDRAMRAYVAEQAVRLASLRTSHASDSQADEGPTCRVHFMDFAGQSVFNSTHTMFMTHRAIYLLVLDISRALASEVEDDDVYCIGANRRMTVEDLTEFLMRSIHVYRGDEPDSYPKVFLVGTHKDLVEETTAKIRMDRIVTKFKDTPLEKHVVGYFIVDCSTTDDPEINKLRQSIFKIAEKEPHWGIETPTRWLPLENDIIEKRESGERVLTLQTIRDMNKECFVRLHSDDEIEVFLRFYNDIGNLMYFGGSAPDVLVILDPQWLVDALKQIITHKQFFLTPERVKAYMKDFTECAKLEKKLIEAVWSGNKDKTFITHMKQLLIIMEQTDVIATPLTYNKDGKAADCSYYFVPTMLKPNKEGKAKVSELLRGCHAKSPQLLFVFRDKFMQPAIFPRLQAECTSIYKLKEVYKQPLLFHQVAVLQLNRELDLVIEQTGHIIQVTIINEKGFDINPEICENVRLIIDDALKKIVQLYGNTELPYQMAVKCQEASTDLDGLITWNELEKFDRVYKENVLGPWITFKASDKDQRISKKVSIDIHERLGFRQLGRLARRLNPAGLLDAARTAVTDAEWKQSEIDNKGHVVGQVYDTLMKWSACTSTFRLNLEAIHEALKESGSETAIELLQEAVADTDFEMYFKGFDQIFLEKRVNDESIDLIAQRCAKTYRFLALELGIDHHVIETVVHDINGVTHRAKKLLSQWRKNSGSRATYREISQAICEVKMDNQLLQDCQAVADTDFEKFFKGFDQIFLEKRVNDESIKLIAQRSAETYRFLALELGIDHHVIETVVQDIDGASHRAKKLLRLWRQNSGSRATYRKIGEAMCEVNMDNQLLQDCQRQLTAVADTDFENFFKGFDQIFLEKRVNDESIKLIAQRSAETYRFLALELGIDHHVIETVVQDIDGATHRAKTLLRLWRQNSGSRATYRKIGEAMCEVNMDNQLLQDCQRQLTAVADTDFENFFKGFDQIFLEKTVNDESIKLIAQRSAETYRLLALELGIDHHVIATVVHDIDGATHRAKTLLRLWRQNSGSRATYRKIGEAMCEVNMDNQLLQDCQRQLTAVAETDFEKFFKGFDQIFLEKRVNDESIKLIAQRSAETYRFLALELGIDHHVIATVVHDIDGATHRAKKLLKLWRQNSGSRATYRKIGEAMCEVNMDNQLLQDCQRQLTEKTKCTCS